MQAEVHSKIYRLNITTIDDFHGLIKFQRGAGGKKYQ